MALSNQNSGKQLLKTAKLYVFTKKLVKTANFAGEKLRKKAAEDKKLRVWKYIADRTDEIRASWK